MYDEEYSMAIIQFKLTYNIIHHPDSAFPTIHQHEISIMKNCLTRKSMNTLPMIVRCSSQLLLKKFIGHLGS